MSSIRDFISSHLGINTTDPGAGTDPAPLNPSVDPNAGSPSCDPNAGQSVPPTNPNACQPDPSTDPNLRPQTPMDVVSGDPTAGQAAQIQMTVLQSIEVREDASASTCGSMTGGTQQQYRAFGQYTDGSAQDITGTVAWSSNSNLVSIKGGLASAQFGEGVVTITATDSSTRIAGSLDVTVTAPDQPADAITKVYVQEGVSVTLPPEYGITGKTIIHGGAHLLEVGVIVWEIARAAGKFYRAATILAGIGAAGALTGAAVIETGILLITLEKSPDPVPPPCPAMCPYCHANVCPDPHPQPDPLGAPIPGRCTLGTGHADQHTCPDNHTW